MSDTKVQDATLTPESLDKVGGGSCSAQDLVDIAGQLADAYESLVDFTSHVIERVAGQ
jgi:hypothetical protein